MLGCVRLADGPICRPDKVLCCRFASYLKTEVFFLLYNSSLNVICYSPAGSQFQCDTSAMTDIVLLVDGSWSIGRSNFKLIKEFLSTLISPFSIAQDKIRVGRTLPCFLTLGNPSRNTVCV